MSLSVVVYPISRGAPSALVSIDLEEGTLSRRVIPVYIDKLEDGGMGDEVTRVASPDSIIDVDANAEGAALFSWLPADKMLGRPPEVVVVALACAYHDRSFKPRELPPIAELFGLGELGRALPYRAPGAAPDVPDLGQVAGEIKKEEDDDPLADLEIDIEV